MNNYNDTKWGCTNKIQPLYNDIDKSNYKESLKRLCEENMYLKKYVSKNNDEINDLSIQFYIKSMKNISIFVLYPKAIELKERVDLFFKLLKEKGDVHYVKDINIEYDTALNLIFQLHTNIMKHTRSVINKANRTGFKNNIKNPIKIIVYTLSDRSEKISISSLKNELIDIFLQEAIRLTPYENIDDRYPKYYDFIHSSDNDNEAYEYSSMFFHKYSLKFLKKQRYWPLFNLLETKIKFNRIKNFIYGKTMMELEKLLLFDSTVLYTYGIREADELNGILLNSSIITTDEINFINKKESLNINYEPNIDDIYKKELNFRAKLIGAQNYEELIMNPKYYYYFMGIKILRLKYEIMIKSSRKIPLQLTDLLMIRHIFKLKYKLKIPKIIRLYNEDNKEIIEEVDREQYLQKMLYFSLFAIKSLLFFRARL